MSTVVATTPALFVLCFCFSRFSSSCQRITREKLQRAEKNLADKRQHRHNVMSCLCYNRSHSRKHSRKHKHMGECHTFSLLGSITVEEQDRTCGPRSAQLKPKSDSVNAGIRQPLRMQSLFPSSGFENRHSKRARTHTFTHTHTHTREREGEHPTGVAPL